MTQDDSKPKRIELWKKLWETDDYWMYAVVTMERTAPHTYKLINALDHALMKRGWVGDLPYDVPEPVIQPPPAGRPYLSLVSD